MNEQDKVPFLDLVTPHVRLEAELLGVVKSALNSAGFIGGPNVEAFEREFAKFCDSPFCVGVSSGTDALRFALSAAGVAPGDTVLTVPNTFIATTEAISQAGAQPDFIDVDPRTLTLSPTKLREYIDTRCNIDKRTQRLVHRESGRPVTAIVPVHLYGQMADMDPIMDVARECGLLVIEDACQAHGAKYFSRREERWYKAGSMGAAAAFSFYPGKNLGACGEAGALTTADERIARQSRMLRDHGQSKKYIHDLEGYNGRLDAIQAGFLRVKLPYLQGWNDTRRDHARVYDELLTASGEAGLAPYVPEWSTPVYHLYVVRMADRTSVQAKMNDAGIGTGIHYPVTLHLSLPYASLGYRAGSFPVAEQASNEVLSLPMFPGLTLESQRRVVTTMLEAMEPATSVAGR